MPDLLLMEGERVLRLRGCTLGLAPDATSLDHVSVSTEVHSTGGSMQKDSMAMREYPRA